MHNSLSDNYVNINKGEEFYNQHADAILGIRASYAHALSPMERVLGHFQSDPVPMNVTINSQKTLVKKTINDNFVLQN